MVSNPTYIKDVINKQNKMYLNHSGSNQRCYINATKMNRILEFHCWAVFLVKDYEVEYDTTSATTFNFYWVDSITDEESMEDPKAIYQSTEVLVTIPSFIGMDWYEVKSNMVQLLATCIR